LEKDFRDLSVLMREREKGGLCFTEWERSQKYSHCASLKLGFRSKSCNGGQNCRIQCHKILKKDTLRQFWSNGRKWTVAKCLFSCSAICITISFTPIFPFIFFWTRIEQYHSHSNFCFADFDRFIFVLLSNP
jgi:hypothetical protein